MQAANLFERMVKGLTKALGRADASTLLSSAAGSKGKDAAQRALLALIVSLDAWAGPLKVYHYHVLHYVLPISAILWGFSIINHLHSPSMYSTGYESLA